MTSGADPEPRRELSGLPRREEQALEDQSTEESGADEAAMLARGLPEDQLRQEAETKAHTRQQRFLDTFEYLVIAAMMAIGAGLIGSVAIWFWHMLTPSCWQWLDDEALAQIQDIVTGGVLASVLAEHMRRRLE